MNDVGKPEPTSRLPAVFVFAIAVLPFLLVTPREFTNWDDRTFVLDNGAIQYLTPTNLRLLLTEPLHANYIPLTMLSYAADWSLYGPSARGFGATNAVLYGACCVLLFRCLTVSGVPRETACLAACLFAVHPTHVEPVAWISGRKDLLCLLFLLAMQICFARWLSRQSQSAYWWSVVFLVAAGLSKPIAMSAGVVLWLSAVMLAGRKPARALREVSPHLIVCCAIVAAAFWSQASAGAIRGDDDPRSGAWMLATFKVAVDLLRCFVPVPYSPFYPDGRLDDVPAAIQGIGLLTVFGISLWLLLRYRGSRTRAWSAYGWFAALSFLLPVSGIVPLGWTSFADRYLLIPSIGSCLLVAWWVRTLGRRILIFGVYAMALCAAVLLHVRANDWANSVVLWESTLRRYPDSPIAWKNLTAAYYQRGDSEMAVNTAVTAVQQLPGNESVLRNAIEVLTESGDLHGAQRLLDSAPADQRHRPEFQIASAKLLLRGHHPQEARIVLEQIVADRPKETEAWLALSYADEQLGEIASALRAASEAAAASPDDQEVHRRLIRLNRSAGRHEEAHEAARNATQALPHFREAWVVRVELLRQEGRSAEADAAEAASARYLRPPL